MTMIIGLTGLASSGKDTFADVLLEINKNSCKMAFADTLKDVCAVLFNMDRIMLSGQTEDGRILREQKDEFWSEKLGKDVTPRWLLQHIGTEVFRQNFHQNIWVDCLLKKIKDKTPKPDYVFITDVRFPNEISALKEIGAKIVRIERHPLPGWYVEYKRWVESGGFHNMFDFSIPLLDEAKKQHPSEKEWIGIDKPDIIVQNDGTLEDFKWKTFNAFENLTNHKKN